MKRSKNYSKSERYCIKCNKCRIFIYDFKSRHSYCKVCKGTQATKTIKLNVSNYMLNKTSTESLREVVSRINKILTERKNKGDKL